MAALHDEMAAAGIAAGQFRHVLEQPERQLVMWFTTASFPIQFSAGMKHS